MIAAKDVADYAALAQAAYTDFGSINQPTAVRLKLEQIQLVVDGDVAGTGVAARKDLLQGHLLEKRDRQYL